MAPPVVAAVEAVRAAAEPPGRLIVLTPARAEARSGLGPRAGREPRLVLLCGRYEGFDERIIEILEPELLSIGDYVLSGGEVAAMVVIDAVMRLIPGVLGDAESAVDESFGPDGGLEYPQYTRPREFRGPSGPRNPPERRPRRDRPLATRASTMSRAGRLIRSSTTASAHVTRKESSHAEPTDGAGRDRPA